MTSNTQGTLNVCCWNSRGMSAAVPYLRELITRYDIICLSEHWLHHNRLTFLEEVSRDIDYVAHSSNAAAADSYGSKRGQGGVAVIWRKGMNNITPMVHLKHDRICGIRIQNVNGAVYNLFSVYMPSAGSGDDFLTTLDELGAIMEETEVGSLNIVGGDLNADPGKAGGPRGYKEHTQRGDALMGFCHRYNLLLTNLDVEAVGPVDTHFGPTGQSCIDFIAIPRALKAYLKACKVLDVEDLNTSDHNPVTVKIDFGNMPRTCSAYEPVGKTKWNRISCGVMTHLYTNPVSAECTTLLHTISNREESANNIDDAFDTLANVLIRNANKLPKTSFNRKVKPFWCDELSNLKRLKVKAYREWCAAGRCRDADDVLWIRNKQCKKNFAKRIRQISKAYDDERIQEAIRCAEVDKDVFWRILRKIREGPKIKVPSVKDEGGTVKHDLGDILEVWRRHFSRLATPKEDLSFDEAHYTHVSSTIKAWLREDDNDMFCDEHFTVDEVVKGINRLNGGKTPGHDGVTKEHLINAGNPLVLVLVKCFNMMLDVEYVPKNFRVGIQVPLYKGKNSCTLNVNNYRGITLLSTFSKLFEVLLWARIKPWWEENRIITQLQGACKGGISCLHTAFLLQETVSEQLESHRKIFVCYLDVSKAFDGVWIDGLFYSLRNLGIQGKTWRILYKSYVDFNGRVRVSNKCSDIYPMKCGIHQGGYLSLLKYVAFINSLLEHLAHSGICCTLQGSEVSPLGYAERTKERKTEMILYS